MLRKLLAAGALTALALSGLAAAAAPANAAYEPTPASAPAPTPGATYTPQLAGSFTTLFSPTQPAPAGYMNDHTVFQGPDGVWHIIGISGGGSGHEKSFATATRTSLTSGTWTEGPVIAQYTSSTGEALDAWAPYALNDNGKTYLFYRSNRDGQHTLEILVSSDPARSTWTRMEGITAPGLADTHFRDPMVMKVGSTYLLYATGGPSGGRNSALSVFESTDLVHWTLDAKPGLTISGSATEVSWGSVESPFVFKHGDYYYLSTTLTSSDLATYHDTMIIRSKDPRDFGDFNGVTATGAGTFVTELPLHAPEYVQDGSGNWFVTTAGWKDQSIWDAAKNGVAIAPLSLQRDGRTLPTSGLRRSYALDSASTVPDVSGNGNTATLMGTASYTSAGHTGSGLANGAVGAIIPPAEQNLSGDFTVSAWVKPATAPSNANGIFVGVGQDLNLYAGKPRLSASGDRVISSTAIAAGVWSHVAVRRVGSQLTIFVNGVATGQGTWAGTLSIDRFGMAKAGHASQVLDDVLLYGRGLSDSEIGGLAQATATIPTSGMLLGYTAERSATAVVDGSATHQDGALTAAGTWNTLGARKGSLTVTAGTSAPVTVPTQTLTGDFTIGGWIAPAGRPGNKNALVRGTGFDVNMYDGLPRLHADGADRVVAQRSIAPGVWSHVTVTRAGGALTIYVNGAPAGTGTYTGAISLTQLGIGLAGAAAGSIDDIAVYDRALTPAEVADLL